LELRTVNKKVSGEGGRGKKERREEREVG